MSAAARHSDRTKTVNSCLYEGSVRHRRRGDVENEFRHRLFMVYLDLDELPSALDASRLWSARRPAPAWFRRADHLGDPAIPLADATRELVRERTGVEADGPVRLLTNLRYFGHCFNPVSFYYCFEPGGKRLQALVAEVTNTPWGERHAYVIEGKQRDSAVLDGQFDKALHVSPFMGMDHRYDARAALPAQLLSVHISSIRAGVGASCCGATAPCNAGAASAAVRAAAGADRGRWRCAPPA